MNEIALGTLRIDLAYGVSNTSGCLPIPEAASVLGCATLAGLDTVDTAVA